ncbi:MAG: ROK family protein [Candidatus Brennerbacteria bacterium]
MRTIGIDVGGSKICAVRWNGAHVEKLAVVKTPQSVAALTKTLRRMVEKLEDGKHFKVGTGFAGTVKDGIIISSANNRFLKNYDVARALGRSAKVDNDARTFARAEYAAGAAKGASRAIFFTFGTGVGRAYGIGGHIKNVKRFGPREKWEKRYQRVKGAAALAPFLAEHLMPLINIYQPRIIVAGGGVSEKKGFISMFRAELKKRGFKGVVARAKLGTLAGAIGAAMIVR